MKNRLCSCALVLMAVAVTVQADPVFEGDWSRIRRYGHGQNRYLFSADDLAYIDDHIAYLTVEKIHGSSVFEGGNLDQAAMATAAELKNTKVLLYLQAFYAFGRWQAVVQADYADSDLFVPDEGQYDYAFNQGTAKGREFWASISNDVVNNSQVVGTFVDAIGKISTHGHSDWLPDFYQTMSQLDGLTIYNGAPGLYDYSEGFMREDLVKGTASDRRANFDQILSEVSDNEFMMLNSFYPDYKFPLAGFLILAHEKSFFRYFPLAADGSNHSARWADVRWHCDEYDYPLGAPLGKAVKNGYVYTRSFEHVDVWVNLQTEEYVLAWDSVDSDSDGMDDLWEYRNFGDTTIADPSADSDGDGLTNLEEYHAGTDLDGVVVTNVALSGTATQSSTDYQGVPERAIDDNTNGSYRGGSVTHTTTEAQPWWQVDLGGSYHIHEIVIWGRTDSCCQDRLHDYDVTVLNRGHDPVWSSYQANAPDPQVTLKVNGVMGRYVRIQLRGRDALSLAEVEVLCNLAPQPISEVYTAGSWLPFDCQTLDSLEDYTVEPENLELSLYGGWKARQVEATGYFRVEKIDGRWWAVDPEGYLFVHQALNSVNLNNYNADEICQLLPEYGFNGLGCWSDEAILKSSLSHTTPLAYCPKYSFIGNYRRNRNPRIEMPVFDDAFVSFCNEKAEYFTPYINDPRVFGYFSDNELPWRDEGLPAHLAIADASDKNYTTAINFLADRGKTASNWDTDDQYAYMALMAERYYSVVSAAIKSVDANHMYLGSRCHSTERFIEDFMKNAGKYVDIFTINYYGRWGARSVELQNMADWSERPLLATEFYAMEYSPDNDGAGWDVLDQASRSLFYQNLVSTLAQTKNVVGWHWFKFQDDEKGNKGIVDEYGNLHVSLLYGMRQFNDQVYNFIDYVDTRPVPDVSLLPEADAYFKGSENFGADPKLLVKNASSRVYRESYLRFDTSSLENGVESARIHLYAIATGSEAGQYQAELVTDNRWDEMTITQDNNPPGSTLLASWSDGDDIIIDVTDVLSEVMASDHKLSIRIRSTLNNGHILEYGSREHDNPAAWPVLKVYYPTLRNVALNGTATQSSTANGGSADRAIDGNTCGLWEDDSVTLTETEANAWWQVDLGASYDITEIQIWNRTDSCCQSRLKSFDVTILDASGQSVWSDYQMDVPNPNITLHPQTITGRTVKIRLRTRRGSLNLAEVKVIGTLSAYIAP